MWSCRGFWLQCLGVSLDSWFVGNSPSGIKSLPVRCLKDLSFPRFMGQVDASEWRVSVDRIADTFPPLSRSPRIARRIVAHTTHLKSDQNEFATRFQRSAEDWIASHGATITGQHNAAYSSAVAMSASQLVTLVDLPRRYYAIENTHGVADFWCVSDSVRVTVIISIIEGP